MTDHITSVREQAEQEADSIWGKFSPHDTRLGAFEHDAYVRGQVDLASRLTREKIAKALHEQLMVGDIYLSEFQRLVAADAVLALVAEGEA